MMAPDATLVLCSGSVGGHTQSCVSTDQYQACNLWAIPKALERVSISAPFWKQWHPVIGKSRLGGTSQRGRFQTATIAVAPCYKVCPLLPAKLVDWMERQMLGSKWPCFHLMAVEQGLPTATTWWSRPKSAIMLHGPASSNLRTLLGSLHLCQKERKKAWTNQELYQYG